MRWWVITFSVSIFLNFFNEHILLLKWETEQVYLQADEFLFAMKGNGKELISFDWKNVMNKQYLIIY